MANSKQTIKEKKEKETVSKEKYTELESKLKQMEELVQKLINNSDNNEKQQTVNNITQYIGNENKDVVLTSLTVGQLNLSTEGYGNGAIYTFDNIGEEISIPLDDVKKIVRNNKNFIEGGNVFINDDELIKSLRLENVYKKLLSYEQMQNLFNKDRNAFEKIFSGMTENQKETLRRIIFEKLMKDEKSVDMNIVQVLNDNMNINMMDDIKNQKKILEYLDENN